MIFAQKFMETNGVAHELGLNLVCTVCICQISSLLRVDL